MIYVIAQQVKQLHKSVAFKPGHTNPMQLGNAPCRAVRATRAATRSTFPGQPSRAPWNMLIFGLVMFDMMMNMYAKFEARWMSVDGTSCGSLLSGQKL